MPRGRYQERSVGVKIACLNNGSNFGRLQDVLLLNIALDRMFLMTAVNMQVISGTSSNRDRICGFYKLWFESPL